MTKTEHLIKRQGLNLYAVSWGNPQKTPIVLVHGYPDNHSVWQKVAEQLARKYYVVSYDVRGAGQSDKPTRTADYAMLHLAADLQAVVNQLLPNRAFHLAGHDWGSIQSWESVTSGPLQARIASYTTISGPCLDHMGYWMREHSLSSSLQDKAKVLKQVASSWYIGMFQLPVLAPSAWNAGLDRLWPRYLQYREGVETPDDNPSQRDDGKYGVQLYRANFRAKLLKPQQRRAQCPVQLIVPTQDNYVGTHLFDDLHRWVPQLYRRDIRAPHWVPLTHPQLLAQWLDDFVRAVDSNQLDEKCAHLRVKPEREQLPLARKIAVVTGAGSGIGRATALKLASQGAHVVCTDIDETSAAATADACRALGSEAWSQAVDVSATKAMETLARWVERELGGADLVVNNAGVGFAGGVLDTSVTDWNRVLKVNLWGVIHGSRLFAEQMRRQQRSGHIVNVASAAAFAPNRKLAAYATSKAAVFMLSECLRAELAEHGIGVSAICPGLVSTNIVNTTTFAGVSEEEQARIRAKNDALYRKRNLTPDAVAEAIYDAIRHNHAVTLVGTEASALRLTHRLAPALSRELAKLDLAY